MVAIPGISVGFNASDSIIPYLIIIGGGVLGYFLGKLFSKSYIKSKSNETYVNIFEIPVVENKIGRAHV